MVGLVVGVEEVFSVVKVVGEVEVVKVMIYKYQEMSGITQCLQILKLQSVSHSRPVIGVEWTYLDS